MNGRYPAAGARSNGAPRPRQVIWCRQANAAGGTQAVTHPGRWQRQNGGAERCSENGTQAAGNQTMVGTQKPDPAQKSGGRQAGTQNGSGGRQNAGRHPTVVKRGRRTKSMVERGNLRVPAGRRQDCCAGRNPAGRTKFRKREQAEQVRQTAQVQNSRQQQRRQAEQAPRCR